VNWFHTNKVQGWTRSFFWEVPFARLRKLNHFFSPWAELYSQVIFLQPNDSIYLYLSHCLKLERKLRRKNMARFLNPSKNTNSGKTNLVQFDWGENDLRATIRIYLPNFRWYSLYLIYDWWKYDYCVCTVYVYLEHFAHILFTWLCLI